MAQRISLRDYQRELAERLRLADSARSASKLGVQIGEQNWLIDLVEAGEVMPVPPITAVPLTRPWFRGVANVRGNLYSVVDFAEFLGTGSRDRRGAPRLLGSASAARRAAGGPLARAAIGAARARPGRGGARPAARDTPTRAAGAGAN